MEKKDKAVNKVVSILKKKGSLTITELVDNSRISRSAIRTALAKLDGAEKVKIRNIGMAKVYSLNNF
ncbi:MAG: ArsR family transcriptional regulator [Candidatus Pacearchaeota archaeon]|jgi:DeoR/GlpR family transcriptional regulator of sugar metabolism